MKNFPIKRSGTIVAERALIKSKTIQEVESHRNISKQANDDIYKHNHSIDPTKFDFFIDPISLENIVSNYKDRIIYNNSNEEKEYPDLDFFEEHKGIQILIDSLKTSIESGIISKDKRKELFGSNKNDFDLPPFSLYLLESMEDPMVQLLVIFAIISIVLGCTLSDEPKKDWIDGLSIIIAILFVVLVGSITKYEEKKQFAKLNKIQGEETKYKVIRKGEVKKILNEEILVGDLILINYGEIIPADILLVEGNGIKIDEMAITGEAFPVKKDIYSKCDEIKKNGGKNVPSPLILSGTKCVQGSGRGIVLCVGVHSQKNLMNTIKETDKDYIESPLNNDLENISRKIAFYGFIVGLVIFISLLIRFGIEFHNNLKAYKKNEHLKIIMKTFLFNFPHKIKDNVIESIAIKDNVTKPTSLIAKNILDIIILSISIIVIAIPEGLSSAIVLSFAFSLKEMMNHNNLIRRTEACELMGSANYIITDKTGILTTNDMKINKIVMGNGEVVELENIINSNKLKRNNPLDFFKSDIYWNLLKFSISLNIECEIQRTDIDDIDDEYDEKCDSFNKIDKALIDFLHKFGVCIILLRDKYLSEHQNYKIFQFNQKSKRMTSIIKNQDFPTGYRLFSKGASEKLTKFCNSYIDPNTGNIENINNDFINSINNSISKLNKEKFKTLYIAYKDITKEEFENCENENQNGQFIDENNLILLAIIVINDPIHKEVKEAVEICKNSYINVIMATGDNIMTATSVAKDCGILDNNLDLNNLRPNDFEHNPELMNDIFKKCEYIDNILVDKPKILTGNTFYEIIGGIICKICNKDINLCNCPKTDEEARLLAQKNEDNNLEPILYDVRKEEIKNMENFKKIIRNLKVLARVESIHKYSLVLGLKSLKNIVAVTGKGTNDASSLYLSDVAISMFSGTDIAKEASDIIIMDNNFNSIITAIIYGRNICENIRKFLQFQLSVNFPSCFSVFICSVIGNETPLTAVQLLWINLIMDSFGAMALATEPPYKDILIVKPKKRSESLITGKMYKHIIFQSIALFAIMVFLYVYGPKFIPEDNLVKIAENVIIKYCYGKIPGNEGNEKLIISGAKDYWSADIYLKESINKDYCGSYSSRQNLNVAFKEYININSNSSHMTLIFNVFVFYSLFNQINCRILDDSLNIFKRINNSYLFLLIISLEIIIQIIIIFFGSTVFHISEMGLTWRQWLISLGFSAITFIISLIAKFINLDKHIEKCFPSNDDTSDNVSIIEIESKNSDDIDPELSEFEKKYKLEESNACNEHNKKDNADHLKMSDFTQDCDTHSNINKN